MGYSVNNNEDPNMAVMRAESERDRQSSASTQARDAMDGMNAQQIIGGLAEIFKILGAFLSG